MNSKDVIDQVEEQDLRSKVMNMLSPSLLLLLCMVMLFSEYAFAQTEDALRVHATSIENFLTGNIMRGVAVTGNIWGLIQSYMKSSALILSSVIGIDLLGWGMLAWVKTTWACVI